jgi:predicted Mrr-cat superfamily restriction endonuclease
VVVPYGSNFLVAQVAGNIEYREDKAEEDTAHRRKVTWLNDGQGIPRIYARSALHSRMSIRGTSADATDLLDEIQEALQQAQTGESPSFANDLRIRLVEQTLQEIRSGRIENFGFERLVANLMLSLGALEAPILNRATEDKGADILASFMLAQTFEFTIAIQAKHYGPDPPVEPTVVDQLVVGMESAGTPLGWVVTSGTFSEEAALRVAEKEEQYGYQIQLIDGEQLSAMIVEGGLHGVGVDLAPEDLVRVGLRQPIQLLLDG